VVARGSRAETGLARGRCVAGRAVGPADRLEVQFWQENTSARIDGGPDPSLILL
jgi:hypothetical protein